MVTETLSGATEKKRTLSPLSPLKESRQVIDKTSLSNFFFFFLSHPLAGRLLWFLHLEWSGRGKLTDDTYVSPYTCQSLHTPASRARELREISF